MCVLVLAVGACRLLRAEQSLPVAGGDSGTWQWALPSPTIPAPGQPGGSGLCPSPPWHLPRPPCRFSVGFSEGLLQKGCREPEMCSRGMSWVLCSQFSFELGFHTEEIGVTFGCTWFGSCAKMLWTECKINILFQIEYSSFRSWGLDQFCLSCFIFMAYQQGISSYLQACTKVSLFLLCLESWCACKSWFWIWASLGLRRFS